MIFKKLYEPELPSYWFTSQGKCKITTDWQEEFEFFIYVVNVYIELFCWFQNKPTLLVGIFKKCIESTEIPICLTNNPNFLFVLKSTY